MHFSFLQIVVVGNAVVAGVVEMVWKAVVVAELLDDDPLVVVSDAVVEPVVEMVVDDPVVVSSVLADREVVLRVVLAAVVEPTVVDPAAVVTSVVEVVATVLTVDSAVVELLGGRVLVTKIIDNKDTQRMSSDSHKSKAGVMMAAATSAPIKDPIKQNSHQYLQLQHRPRLQQGYSMNFQS